MADERKTPQQQTQDVPPGTDQPMPTDGMAAQDHQVQGVSEGVLPSGLQAHESGGAAHAHRPGDEQAANNPQQRPPSVEGTDEDRLGQAGQPQQLGRADQSNQPPLEELTKAELEEVAQREGVAYPSGATKADIIEAIEAKRAGQ